MPLTSEQIDEVFASFGDEQPKARTNGGAEPTAADAEITRLAKLTALQYEQERRGSRGRPSEVSIPPGRNAFIGTSIVLNSLFF